MNEVLMSQQQQVMSVPSPRNYENNNNHIVEAVPEMNHNENGDEQDESLFNHNLDQTAPPMNNQRDTNFMM
jgi:hypothetical protein